MRSPRGIVALAMGAGVALLLSVLVPCVCSGAPEADVDPYRWPAAPFLMQSSPTGERLAVMLLGDPSYTCPTVVVDRTGKVEADTTQSPPAVHGDQPLGWFPDGQSILLWRRFPGETSWTDGSTDLVVLRVADGSIESLSGGKGGLKAGTALDATTVVCHATNPCVDMPGLYFFRRSGGVWSPQLILADTDEHPWTECLWASAGERGYRLIAEAEEQAGEDIRATTYWEVTVQGSQMAKADPIATFEVGISGEAVSPDGAFLAVVRRDHRLPRRLALVALEGAARQIEDVQCGADVLFPCFSPSGDKLLLWRAGFLPGTQYVGAPRGEMLVMDVASHRISGLRLPSELREQLRDVRGPAFMGEEGSLSAVCWLSDDSLALAFDNYGIATMNLETGQSEALWRIPLDYLAPSGQEKGRAAQP